VTPRPGARHVVIVDLIIGAIIATIVLLVGPGLAIIGIAALVILFVSLLASAPTMVRRSRARRRARRGR
jgi:ABC-type bacteriocin/lantibiotic exporter with double-glycine peptidase domain